MGEGLKKIDRLDLFPKIEIAFNHRLRTTLGTATVYYGPARGLIHLSSEVFLTAKLSEKKETVIHELAHVVTNLNYGRQMGHGREWKTTMKALGYPDAKRCHSAFVRKNKCSKYKLKCRKCAITIEIHKKTRTSMIKNIKSGRKRYWCKKCKSIFSYADCENAKYLGKK